MEKQNKRPITDYIPSPTSKPVLEKRKDNKTTPNKPSHGGIDRIEEEMEEFGGGIMVRSRKSMQEYPEGSHK
jgi:hypothetical protein